MDRTTTTSGVVPMPEAWTTSRSRSSYLWAAVLVLAGAVWLALKGSDILAGEDTWAHVSIAGVALIPWSSALLHLDQATWPGRRSPAVETVDGHGLRFRYRERAWWATVACMLAMLPSSLIALPLGIAGLASDGWTGDVLFPLVIGTVGTAVFGYLVVSIVTGRMRRGEVRVTTEGVTNQTWSGEASLRWEDVRGVDPVDVKGPRLRLLAVPGRTAAWTRHERLAVSEEKRNLPGLVVDAALVEGDAALLAHAVAWYLEHPEARSELASDAAVRRVRAGEAVVAG